MSALGVAVAGFGVWGGNLARNISGVQGAHLVAIADPDPARRAEAAARHADVSTVATVEALLKLAEVEAVVLATPASTHGPLALAVLESGRHVLVEKPLAMTVPDADAVSEIAASGGLTAMVGHTFLYSAPVRWLRESIHSGILGQVQYLYSQRLNLGTVRRDCNALWNFAPHDVAIMLYLLDEVPSVVTGKGFSFLQKGIDDVCFASLTFPSGVGANLHVSWVDPRKTRTMTVVGDARMAVFNDVSVDQKIWVYDSGIAPLPAAGRGEFATLGDFQWQTRAGDITIPRIEMREPLQVEVEAFVEACRTGTRPVADAHHGATVVRVLAAIETSTSSGGAPVEVEP